MKKEIKDWTNKSCKNCEDYDECGICGYVGGLEDVDADRFHCSLFEEKKKTITLYRYTYEDDGEVWISNWTSKQRGLPRGCSVLKTETKEIDL